MKPGMIGGVRLWDAKLDPAFTGTREMTDDPDADAETRCA